MVVKANGANFSGSGAGIVAVEGSTVNANGANLSGCSIGIISDNISDVSINNADLSNCGIGVFSGSIVDFIKKLKDDNIDFAKFQRMLNELHNTKEEAKKEKVIKNYGFFEILSKLQAIDFVTKKLQLLCDFFK